MCTHKDRLERRFCLVSVNETKKTRHSRTKIKTNMLSRQHTVTSNTERQRNTQTHIQNKKQENSCKKQTNNKRHQEAESNYSSLVFSVFVWVYLRSGEIRDYCYTVKCSREVKGKDGQKNKGEASTCHTGCFFVFFCRCYTFFFADNWKMLKS